MRFIDNIRFVYHIKKAAKAMNKNDKRKYDKHMKIIDDLFWKRYRAL